MPCSTRGTTAAPRRNSCPGWWLQPIDKDPTFARDRQDASYPFSLCPHGCLGQQLAWLELRVILARFFWKFDIEIPTGTKALDWNRRRYFGCGKSNL